LRPDPSLRTAQDDKLFLSAMAKTLLFLCTGNYYRSRFAEIVFNHLATAQRLNWRAESRGLARQFGAWNVGPISKYAIEALAARDISCPSTARNPMYCFEEDLARANLVIALKEAEHRPMLAEHFPGWEGRVEYWHVHDLDAATPDEALSQIERQVTELVERISR
jgi:low molecular weight protein-tyrosine phosphatase